MNAPATTARGEVMTRNQALARIQDTLDHENFLSRISATAVKGLEARQVANVALNVIRTSEKLQKCEPLSIAGALCQAASTGLLPGNGLGHAYLIPRWNKKTGQNECHYQIGYQGWRELVMRTGHVRSIVSRCVYEGDDFSYSWGTEASILHEPGEKHGTDPQLITHAYAIAHMRDAPPVIEVMPRQEVERIRGKSRSKDEGPWVTDWAEMARKTVIIRLCKSLPRTVEITRALETVPEEEDFVEGEVEVIDPETGEVTRHSLPAPEPARTPPPPASSPPATPSTAPAAGSTIPVAPPSDPPLSCFDCQKMLDGRHKPVALGETDSNGDPLVVCKACWKKREKSGPPLKPPEPNPIVDEARQAREPESADENPFEPMRI